MIIKAAKRIFNSDKICRSYSDLNFGVTFFGTQCSYTYRKYLTTIVREVTRILTYVGPYALLHDDFTAA